MDTTRLSEVSKLLTKTEPIKAGNIRTGRRPTPQRIPTEDQTWLDALPRSWSVQEAAQVWGITRRYAQYRIDLLRASRLIRRRGTRFYRRD